MEFDEVIEQASGFRKGEPMLQIDYTSEPKLRALTANLADEIAASGVSLPDALNVLSDLSILLPYTAFPHRVE